MSDSPQKKKPVNVEALAEKLIALPTAQKLAMAIMLLQGGKADVAESVVSAALDDLQARRLLGIARVPLCSNRERADAR